MDTEGFDIVEQRESVAITYGREYDFGKILSAYAALIEVLAISSGGPAWIKPTPWLYGPDSRMPLDNGRLREAWGRIRDRYQFTDEHISHVIGSATYRAYLLGRTQLVYDLKGHTLCEKGSQRPVGYCAAPDGRTTDRVAIESEPEIEVFGRLGADGTMYGAPAYVIERVQGCIEGTLRSYGMKFDSIEADDSGHLGVISFPFKRFRATKEGYGHVRVRCSVLGTLPSGAMRA